MANAGGGNVQALAEAGWKASRDTWIKLISTALTRRNMAAHHQYIEVVLKFVFENNVIEGGNIGWSTIDSYVGYLQATDQLPTPIKSHDIKFHRDTLNWKPRAGGKKKKFDPAKVFGGQRPSSTVGTRVIRSKW
jgi:hypothetical protein